MITLGINTLDTVGDAGEVDGRAACRTLDSMNTSLLIAIGTLLQPHAKAGALKWESGIPHLF